MDPIGFDHRIKDLQSRRIAASMLIDEMEREAGCTPKWMVKIMENSLLKLDDLGVKPTIFGNIQLEVLGIIDKTLRFSD